MYNPLDINSQEFSQAELRAWAEILRPLFDWFNNDK